MSFPTVIIVKWLCHSKIPKTNSGNCQEFFCGDFVVEASYHEFPICVVFKFGLQGELDIQIISCAKQVCPR